MADRSAWLADLDELEVHLAETYANLEWAIENGVTPHRLDEEARASIEGARFRRSARKAVEGFLEGFGDPHLRMKNGDHTPSGGGGPSGEGIAPDASANDALSAMGFGDRNLDFRLGFEKLPGFERVETTPGDPFAWATFDVEPGRKAGVLRFAHFGVDAYRDVAAPLWPRYAASLTEACDDWCQWRFWILVQNRLLEHVADGVRVLEDKGIEALLIDVTGNGGGNDWAGVVPRVLAPPLRNCPQAGFVKHAHHSESIAARRDRLASLLSDLSLTEEARAMLESAHGALEVVYEEASRPCDRTALFRHADAHLDCSNVSRVPGCGVVEYAPANALEGFESRGAVFSPLRFEYEEGAWTGPLFVVMDRHSASASEQFVALLQANDAATFIGETTLGAGCGYTRNGLHIHLDALDVTVFVPDCVRYQGDGRNELEGIDPDVELDWTGSSTDKARAVRDAMAAELN